VAIINLPLPSMVGAGPPRPLGRRSAALLCTTGAGENLRAGIEARDDLAAAMDRVAREVEARSGSGPVTGSMSAHVIEAAPAH
jgi:hypothetical protein